MGRFVRLGAAADILPEIVSSHAEPGQDYPVGSVVVGSTYPYLSRRVRRMFWLPRHPVRSQAALNRMTGHPKWFMSSQGPASGALFIDTDGRRIQDGDDF